MYQPYKTIISSLTVSSVSPGFFPQTSYPTIGDQLFNRSVGKVWFSYQLFGGVIDHLFKMPEIPRRIEVTDRLFRGVESFINRDFV